MRGANNKGMRSNQKNMPWWLIIITGTLIIAAGIYLLAANNTNPTENNPALNDMTFIVGLGVLLFGLYCFIKAAQSKRVNKFFVPFLIQGLLDIILFLLIFFIKKSSVLLGIILASWFIVFGVFGIIHASQDGGDKHRMRISALLTLIGVGLLIVPFLFGGFGGDRIIFFGIVILIIGIVRIAQGIIYKVKLDDRTSGGRSNLV